MNAVGWVCVGMVGGFIFSIIMYVISLTSRRSDFETDDLEWESGNVNVKAYNKLPDCCKDGAHQNEN